VNHGLPLETLQLEYVIDGTVEDSRTTIRRMLYKPLVYFRVKLVDVPQDVATILPLHPGGYVHLHPKDVEGWLWQRCLKVWKNINNNIWRAPFESIDSALLFAAQHTYAKMMNMPGNKEAEEIRGVSVEVLPPCMQLQWRARDQERQQIIRALGKANVDIEDCGNIFNALHQREEPGATIDDTRAHWNWGYYVGDKKREPERCPSFVDNAKKRATTRHVIKCPYVKSPLDTVDGCKTQCMAELRSRFKQPPPYALPENLWGPHNYIRWSHQAIEYEKSNTT